MSTVKVRFFGLIRLDIKQDSVEIDAANVKDLLKKVSIKYDLNLEGLKDLVIFINGVNMGQLKGLKTELKNGDEVQMFSPVAGG